MIDGKKLVCVTPAGRLRYMRELVPFILSEPMVDRYDIWANTSDPADLAFIDSLTVFDKVRVLPRPQMDGSRFLTIHTFFRHSHDEDTVYIRFDDDVVYVEEGTIPRLARYRLDHPEFFVVTPVVVNNAVISSLLQARGILPVSPKVQPDCLDPVGWQSSEFAVSLWERLLGLIRSGRVADLHTDDTVLGFNRFSINCISWLGSAFAEFDGVVDPHEEFDLTVTKPAQRNLSNGLYGGAVVGHFAFYSQRDEMDKSTILEQVSAVNGGLSYVDQSIRRQVAALADDAIARHPPQRPQLRTKVRQAARRLLRWARRK